VARTTEDWVRSISALLKNAELRKTFAVRGRELVERKYSLDQFCEGYIQLMREVAGGDGGRRVVGAH
jgi:glycosyltransferase involved in cell wall biosynthesis